MRYANTTKATGGSAISANTARTPLSALPTDLAVVVGDRIRLRAAATGTLAGRSPTPNSSFVSRRSTPTALYEGCAGSNPPLPSMTCAEIISKFETYVDDTTELSTAQNLPS